jgi:FAD/FMN-containing dehydrogenase
LIARCTGAADVQQAVNFAREHNLLTAVRAGGPSYSRLVTLKAKYDPNNLFRLNANVPRRIA